MISNTFIKFGTGNYGVVVGTYNTEPAVFVFPVTDAGPVGEYISEPYLLDDLAPNEIVFTFPTIEQAEAVADAFVNNLKRAT